MQRFQNLKKENRNKIIIIETRFYFMYLGLSCFVVNIFYKKLIYFFNIT